MFFLLETLNWGTFYIRCFIQDIWVISVQNLLGLSSNATQSKWLFFGKEKLHGRTTISTPNHHMEQIAEEN